MRMTRRHRRAMCQMQRRVLEALEQPGHRRVLELRATVRQCVHLGLPEVAKQARQLAKAGGTA